MNIVKLTFLRTCFLTLPAMAALGWAARYVRWELIIRGVHVNSALYAGFAVAVIYIPAWLTLRPFVAEMRKRKLEAGNSRS